MLRLLNAQIHGIRIGVLGAKIIVKPLPYLKEAICAISGPAAGFLPLFTACYAPHIALIGLAQSCYNLLPIYPLDGGRAVRCIFLHIFPLKIADILSSTLSLLTIIFLTIHCVRISIMYTLGWVPTFYLAIALLLILKNSLQSVEKNSTIQRRTNLRGNQYDFVTSKSTSASAKACTIYRRRI